MQTEKNKNHFLHIIIPKNKMLSEGKSTLIQKDTLIQNRCKFMFREKKSGCLHQKEKKKKKLR